MTATLLGTPTVTIGKRPLACSLLDIKRGKPITTPEDVHRTKELGELVMAWWCSGDRCQWRGQPWNAWTTTARRAGVRMVGDLRVLLAHHAFTAGFRSIPHLLVIREGAPFVRPEAVAHPELVGAAVLAWAHEAPQVHVEMVELPDGTHYRETIAIKVLLRHNLGLFEVWLRSEEENERRKASEVAPVEASSSP